MHQAGGAEVQRTASGCATARNAPAALEASSFTSSVLVGAAHEYSVLAMAACWLGVPRSAESMELKAAAVAARHAWLPPMAVLDSADATTLQ